MDATMHLKTATTGTVNNMFDALSSPRRRAAIAMLDEHAEGVELRDMADRIAAHEVREDVTPGERRNSQQAVYVSLYQCHIPKLRDYRIVNVNESDGQGGDVIHPAEEFERALATMRPAEGERSASLTGRLRSLL